MDQVVCPPACPPETHATASAEHEDRTNPTEYGAFPLDCHPSFIAPTLFIRWNPAGSAVRYYYLFKWTAMRRAKPPTNKSAPAPKRGRRGFVQTGGILAMQIRKASEKRGFSETRLLTHWADIAGPSVANMARPVKVSYGRQGIGAVLTLLCTGANAPLLQMQLPGIINRVNACYGYSAISRINITQTSPSGFADPPADFTHQPQKAPISSEQRVKLETRVSDVADEGLRQALANLGEHILTNAKIKKRG